jgi:hypothetical protein
MDVEHVRLDEFTLGDIAVSGLPGAAALLELIVVIDPLDADSEADIGLAEGVLCVGLDAVPEFVDVP